MIEAIVALVASAISIVLARKYNKDILFTHVMLIMPLIYVGFALYGDITATAMKELLWGAPIFLIALVTYFHTARWVLYLFAAGWFLHGTYDLMHDSLFINNGIPSWYPVLCGVYDYAAVVYILAMAAMGRESPTAYSFKAAPEA